MLTLPEQSESVSEFGSGEPATDPVRGGSRMTPAQCGSSDPCAHDRRTSRILVKVLKLPTVVALLSISLGLLAGYALGAPEPFDLPEMFQARSAEMPSLDTAPAAFVPGNRLPVWPGLQTADLENSSRACINGLVYEKRRFGVWRAAAVPAPLDEVSGLPSNCRARGL